MWIASYFGWYQKTINQMFGKHVLYSKRPCSQLDIDVPAIAFNFNPGALSGLALVTEYAYITRVNLQNSSCDRSINVMLLWYGNGCFRFPATRGFPECGRSFLTTDLRVQNSIQHILGRGIVGAEIIWAGSGCCHAVFYWSQGHLGCELWPLLLTWFNFNPSMDM